MSTPPNEQRGRAPRAWYVLYVVLAVLDLTTVSFTLYQHHRVTLLLDAGASANAALNVRQRDVARLETLAAQLDGAVNDVFASGDIAAQRAIATASSGDFARALSSFRATTSEPELTTALDRVATEMNGVSQGAAAVFSSLERGDATTAGAQMAGADAAYRRAREQLASLSAAMNGAQDRAFAEQRVAAEQMRRVQTVVALLIAGILVGMIVYGRSVAQQVLSAREREEFEQEQRRSAARLSASEERFRLAARATTDVIWDWDLSSNSVWFNEAFQTKLGYAAAGELHVSDWTTNLHPDDEQRVLESVHHAIERGDHFWSAEYRFRRADGSYGEFLDRAYVVTDDTGNAVRMIGAMLDVTERNQSQAALHKLNADISQLSARHELILNAAADGIFGLGLDGQATFLNAAAAKMVGATLDDMKGRTVHEVVHHSHADGTPFPPELCPKLNAMRTEQPSVATEDVFWRKDGTSFAVEYTATPMRSVDGETVGAVVTFRDITERRAVQRLKDEFVSLVSHELRTPLTSIRGALGLLAGGLLQKSPEKGQRMLEIAVSNTDRLVRLINDILDLERIDSGKVTLSKQRCEPLSLLHDSAELMRPMADKAGVHLEVSGAVVGTVWADSDRITQTITNLLSNAIKFSPPQTTISLSADYGRDGIVFRVADQGRGIPKEKLETIFERFQQVDASDSRDKGGSGLGLAICRSIVREHGGDIHVESTVGGGSVFSFSLPAAAAQLLERPASSGARVIICDDDPGVRETLQEILQQRGYDVAVADGGEELLSLARAAAPDVILLDLFMPGMSGWETMAALRAEPELAGIPVIILSVLSPDETPAPFDPAGWVSKPLDENTLVDALEQALGLGGRKPRVLIVEDDHDLARVISASFERHGIETYHAATGREAIELGRELTPDLLILDLVLPELDGFAVVEWLRTQEQLRRVPLIVYSAADPTADERERLRLGPTQFVTKSRVPPAEFDRKVVQLLDAVTMTNGRFARVA